MPGTDIFETMPDDAIHIVPPSSPLKAVVRPPGSKSITNRALLLAAMAEGPSRISGALFSDDTQRMVAESTPTQGWKNWRIA